jgi:hypothetical protein
MCTSSAHEPIYFMRTEPADTFATRPKRDHGTYETVAALDSTIDHSKRTC